MGQFSGSVGRGKIRPMTALIFGNKDSEYVRASFGVRPYLDSEQPFDRNQVNVQIDLTIGPSSVVRRDRDHRRSCKDQRLCQAISDSGTGSGHDRRLARQVEYLKGFFHPFFSLSCCPTHRMVWL